MRSRRLHEHSMSNQIAGTKAAWRLQLAERSRAVPSRPLRACFNIVHERRVRARGLREMAKIPKPCRPGPLTGRFLKHALRQLHPIMANDTPERFARLVLAELADIHALVMGIHDYIMLDLAHTARIPVAEARKGMQKKRKERAKRY